MGLELIETPEEQRANTVGQYGNDLHQLSQMTDAQAEDKDGKVLYTGAQAMKDEINAINKLDPEMRKDIFQSFQKRSASDPLFINDVKMNGDKLEFSPQHKVTPELKSAEQDLLNARAQNMKDAQAGNIAAMIGPDRREIEKATNSLQQTERDLVKSSGGAGNAVLEIPPINSSPKK